MTVAQLETKYPNLNFATADTFVWSPKKQVVYYNPKKLEDTRGMMSLLHEVGHALLGHTTYDFDIELLDMEVEAWVKARELADQHNIKLNELHIDACLETYRIWLYKRSRCPLCSNTSLQKLPHLYYCFLCNAEWRVAHTRTTQPRRMDCIVLN